MVAKEHIIQTQRSFHKVTKQVNFKLSLLLKFKILN